MQGERSIRSVEIQGYEFRLNQQHKAYSDRLLKLVAFLQCYVPCVEIVLLALI